VNRSCFLNLAAWRTRSSACDTRPALRPVRALLVRVPSAPPLLHRLRRRSTSALFVGFQLLWRGQTSWARSSSLRLLAFPMRAGMLSGQTQDLPVPIRRACAHARSQTTPNRADARVVASARIAFHVKDRVCVRNKNHFRGSMAGLCVPLSTLRRRPHGRLRMTRGHCGSLLLQCSGLSPPTPRRFRRRTLDPVLDLAALTVDLFVDPLRLCFSW